MTFGEIDALCREAARGLEEAAKRRERNKR
jgi:hypothetical protein